jgi:hypothetical protein
MCIVCNAWLYANSQTALTGIYKAHMLPTTEQNRNTSN